MKIAKGVEMLELTATLATGADLIHPTLIWDEATVILVDAGLPGLLPQFQAAITQAGIPFERLTKIIITHHDMDHIGGLAQMLQAASQMGTTPPKIEVLAHEAEKPYIQAEVPPLRLTQIEAQLNSLSEERRPQMQALAENLRASYPKLKVSVNQTLADGETLPYCGGIAVIYTPGHTPGHISLYLKESKTLIAGDMLNVTDGFLVPAPSFTTFDKEAAARSLEKLTNYDIEAVVCYHGGLYLDQVNQRIAEIAGA